MLKPLERLLRLWGSWAGGSHYGWTRASDPLVSAEDLCGFWSLSTSISLSGFQGEKLFWWILQSPLLEFHGDINQCLVMLWGGGDRRGIKKWRILRKVICLLQKSYKCRSAKSIKKINEQNDYRTTSRPWATWASSLSPCGPSSPVASG